MVTRTTARRDIVVVGASAGGVEALVTLVQGLPADLPAAVFVVLHVPPTGPSHLPAILARAGPLPAVHAAEGVRIERGHLYIAPPDRHLLVRHGYVEVTRGPRENRMRPAADALFRSAARTYGPRVVGVVLSGTLDDGSLGLRAIEARGGVTVVQDPAEALFDGMPRAALRYARVDYTLPVGRIAPLLAHLAQEDRAGTGRTTVDAMDDEDLASALIRRDMAAQARDERSDATTVYTCPECGGTLWQVDYGGLTHFHCHVGHSYGAEALLGQMSEELEAGLWSAVRLLEEKATLARQLARRMRANGQEAAAALVEEQAEVDDRQGHLIRDALLQGGDSLGARTLAVAQASGADGDGHTAHPAGRGTPRVEAADTSQPT